MLNSHHLVKEIESISKNTLDRRQFHQEARVAMKEMAQPEFVHFVFEQNLNDHNYLTREWSTYEIPYLYVHETDHYYVKYHIFPSVKSKDSGKTGNIIHHHNNYLLTSLTAFGSGYKTLHFDKQIEDLGKDEVKLKISQDFFHGNMEFSFVDSYEPHVVGALEDLSVTLVLWSPDQKLKTDALRNHPLVKPFKKQIISAINLLKLNRTVGIADKKTYQWYVENGKCLRILEADYFGMYKDKKGAEVDLYYAQAISSYLQKIGYHNEEFLKLKIADNETPEHWKHWLSFLLTKKPIPEVFSKEKINIPSGEMRIDDIRVACK